MQNDNGYAVIEACRVAEGARRAHQQPVDFAVLDKRHQPPLDFRHIGSGVVVGGALGSIHHDEEGASVFARRIFGRRQREKHTCNGQHGAENAEHRKRPREDTCQA